MNIKVINNPQEIVQCFDAFLELRPHLSDSTVFTDQVLKQQKEGYQLAAILQEDEIVACVGFRMMTMLANGKILYIDDLVTKEKCRGKGYGKALLDYTIQFAKDNLCDQVHLDTGYTRHAAHKVYLNYGFEIFCHHMALNLS